MKETRIKKIEEAVLADLSYRDRLRMTLEARDRETARRLLDTCPRKVYRMKAADFADIMDNARRLANAGVIIYERARYAREVLAASAKGKKKASGQVLAEFKAAWEAFDLLCRETLNLDGLTLITGLPLVGGWPLSEDWTADLAAMIGEKIPAETAADRNRRRKLAKYWTRTLKEAFKEESER